MTIIEFLEARISQDEDHARKLAETDRRPILSIANTINHPQRLLAECAAKRAIIGLHSPIDPCDAHDEQLNTVSCDTLRTLAAIYADHPDYKTEWEL